jgi:hypothetical protein
VSQNAFFESYEHSRFWQKSGRKIKGNDSIGKSGKQPHFSLEKRGGIDVFSLEKREKYRYLDLGSNESLKLSPTSAIETKRDVNKIAGGQSR